MGDTENKTELEFAELTGRLPYVLPSNAPGDEVPPELIGATIVAFSGLPPSVGIEGGGLAIDYQRPGESVKRVVFAMNELGMWVVFRSAAEPGK